VIIVTNIIIIITITLPITIFINTIFALINIVISPIIGSGITMLI